MSERDEHAIWQSRWLGKIVDTPDGPGTVSGFSDEGTGISYQVRTINPQGVTTWRDWPITQVKLLRKGRKNG